MATALPQLTPRSHSGGIAQEQVWLSIKDRIYQHSFNLRKTFREIDPDGKGLIPIPVCIEEMGRIYQLSPYEKECLLPLLREADFRNDGAIDFKEFVEMLKMHSKSSQPLSEAEKARFQQKGAMDKRMQEALRSDASREITIQGGLPTNELGPMTIDAPFGVLGDSEKMDAVITTFLNIKFEHLRSVMQRHDSNSDGIVTYAEFRAGMKELDRYVFDDEINILLEALDRKRKGAIVIDDFVKGAGREYLKKKAHRSNSFQSPFVWDESPVAKPTTAGGNTTPRSGRKEGGDTTSPRGGSSTLKRPAMTRGEELRLSMNRAKMTDIFRREEDNRKKRIAAGTSAPNEKAIGSPRLPAINGTAAPSPRKA